MVVKKIAVKHLIKEKTGMRVSPEAVNVIADYVNDMVESIVKSAAEIAKHAKRKTIRAEDIKLVTKFN